MDSAGAGLSSTDARRTALFLALETSCDETGIAIASAERGAGAEANIRILAQTLHSQAALHSAYGGVVPELASRDHVRHALPLLDEALRLAGLRLDQIDAFAYTAGPGLAGALLTGAALAAALAFARSKPLIAVNHLEGHLLSPFMAEDKPGWPHISLLVSGGHTLLTKVLAPGRYQSLGASVDDAAGEAFDKAALLLGLDYPGGAALSRLAERGRCGRFRLPRPLLTRAGLDFSFAGLKTALWTQTQKLPAPLSETDRADLAAEMQAAICETLATKSARALEAHPGCGLSACGGVAANAHLRASLAQICATRGVKLCVPPLALCGDNGAMIAHAAALRWLSGLETLEALSNNEAEIHPVWPLAQSD